MKSKEQSVITNLSHKIAIGNLVLKIGSELSKGKSTGALWDLYRLAKQVQSLFFWESIKLNPDLDLLNRCLGRLHHLLYAFLPVSDIELTESYIVPIGKVKRSVVSELTKVYFGWSATRDALTESQILASDFVSITSGMNQSIVPFQRETSFQYLWFAEAAGEREKEFWADQGNPLNKGEIGGGSNLFASPVVIGGLRLYITNWETIADHPLIFSTTL